MADDSKIVIDLTKQELELLISALRNSNPDDRFFEDAQFNLCHKLMQIRYEAFD